MFSIVLHISFLIKIEEKDDGKRMMEKRISVNGRSKRTPFPSPAERAGGVSAGEVPEEDFLSKKKIKYGIILCILKSTGRKKEWRNDIISTG